MANSEMEMMADSGTSKPDLTPSQKVRLMVAYKEWLAAQQDLEAIKKDTKSIKEKLRRIFRQGASLFEEGK